MKRDDDSGDAELPHPLPLTYAGPEVEERLGWSEAKRWLFLAGCLGVAIVVFVIVLLFVVAIRIAYFS
jgi:hypothetical protein